MRDHLATAFPYLAKQLPKTCLAELPTPVITQRLRTAQGRRNVVIKCDDRTGQLYGGNKVRKLEYLLRRARDKRARRIATFGTVASNHALATSLYARALGFKCTCLLSHQTRTANAARILNLHLQNDTELIRYGGTRSARIHTLRQSLWNRRAMLIPAGGSNWLGAVGFVNAGLELAAQIAAGKTDAPDRIYVANGTMATAVGLALGMALAELTTEVQAIRVTESIVCNSDAMRRLTVKTATLLHSLDASIPADLAERTRYCLRDDFLGAGYAKTNPLTEDAVRIAHDEMGLALETTYTGKAMAAMLHDLDQSKNAGKLMLFWNTYNSQPLATDDERPSADSGLPEDFFRYFD